MKMLNGPVWWLFLSVRDFLRPSHDGGCMIQIRYLRQYQMLKDHCEFQSFQNNFIHHTGIYMRFTKWQHMKRLSTAAWLVRARVETTQMTTNRDYELVMLYPYNEILCSWERAWGLFLYTARGNLEDKLLSDKAR